MADKHITRVNDTLVNIVAGLDDGQSAQLTNTNYEMIWRVGSTFYLSPPARSTVNGTDFTYLTIEANNLYAQSDMKCGANLYHYGDTDTKILFEDDQITISAGAIDFIRLTESTQDAITFNVTGGDMDYDLWTAAVNVSMHISGDTGYVGINTDAPSEELHVNGDIRATNISIGTAGNSAAPIYLYNNALDTTSHYYGLDVEVTKTAGVTDNNDHMRGSTIFFGLNQVGGTIGYLYGQVVEVQIDNGTVGASRDVYGVDVLLDLNTGTVSGTAYGINSTVDIEATFAITSNVAGIATAVYPDCDIGGSVYGGFFYVDQAAGKNITGDTYGIMIDVDLDGTTTGATHMLYLMERSGIDYGIYQNGTAPNVFGGTLQALRIGIGGAPHATEELYVTGTTTLTGLLTAGADILITKAGDSTLSLLDTATGATHNIGTINFDQTTAGTTKAKIYTTYSTVEDIGYMYIQVWETAALATILQMGGSSKAAVFASNVSSTAGNFAVATGQGYLVNGNKIIGDRGAHVADASGGSTVDAEARTAINTLLSRLETHGLLATS